MLPHRHQLFEQPEHMWSTKRNWCGHLFSFCYHTSNCDKPFCALAVLLSVHFCSTLVFVISSVMFLVVVPWYCILSPVNMVICFMLVGLYRQHWCLCVRKHNTSSLAWFYNVLEIRWHVKTDPPERFWRSSQTRMSFFFTGRGVINISNC